MKYGWRFDIVQETGVKTITKKKKCKKVKWLSEESLQMTEKRREAKSMEKRKDIPIPNAEFQIIERRDKNVFLREQCKEIEENK